MADWMDWLEGIAGAAAGTTKGLTVGMDPFAAWEKVRTSDLANDLSDVKLRDAQLTQQALEGLPDFYGNLAAFRDIGNQRGIAQGEYDIFGLGRKLAQEQELSDPYGFFQRTAAEMGLMPGDVDYRRLASAVQSQFDPFGAIAAYDKMGVPGIEQRNLNEQSILAFLQGYARQYDEGAQVIRNSDGTIAIRSSDGEIVPVSGDMLIKAASMMSKADPYAAISAGLRDEMGIQKTNVDFMKALLTGTMRPAQVLQAMGQQRQIALNEQNRAEAALAAFDKQAATSLEDPDVLAQQRITLQQRVQAARQAVQGINTQLQAVIEGGRGVVGVPDFVGPPSSLAPRGASTVTTRPRGAAASRAAGSAGPVPSMVQTPPRRVPSGYGSPRDTGTLPITGQELWGMP